MINASLNKKNQLYSWIISISVVGIVLFWYCFEHLHPRETEFSGRTQGTTYSIKLVSLPLSQSRFNLTQDAIHQRLERIDQAMSLYRDDSELVRFNQQTTTNPIPVSPDLLEVVQAAKHISKASNGAYDMTVAPLVEAWGFGPRPPSTITPPTESQLASLKMLVNYQFIEIDKKAGTLRKKDPAVTCDLNGIAQGYTIEKIVKDLRSLGYLHMLVEIGGEVKAIGQNIHHEPWQIGIEKPEPNQQNIQEKIAISNMSVTTAGDYRKYKEVNGTRITHIIDPHTGKPIQHALASVTVVHPSCLMADGYDTALLVLGPEKGFETAAKQNIAAVFIIHDAQAVSGFSVKHTPAFEALFHESETP